MPNWVKDDETWAKAKEQARKQYPGMEGKDKDRFFSIVTEIYKKMGGKIQGRGGTIKRMGG